MAERWKLSRGAGDQQSALFGQLCVKPGDAKNTYGTGCFLLQNIGDKFTLSKERMITTLICSLNRRPEYALEGSIFIGGAVVQWLRDKMQFFQYAPDVEKVAASMEGSNNVVLVPAFTGLGAPYWDPYASALSGKGLPLRKGGPIAMKRRMRRESHVRWMNEHTAPWDIIVIADLRSNYH
jgi:glycerol kinase